MKIDKQDIDQLNAKLSVTIEKEDYLPKLDKELAKYRKEVSLKGFRKGKTPMSVVRRMYGKALLVDAVNEKLQTGIVEYFEKADFDILGQPLDSEANKNIVFDINQLDDFNFVFDIGLSPQFELKDMGEGFTEQRTLPVITDEIINEELETTRKQAGENQPVEDTIQENDMLEISGVELDGDTPKDDGIDSTFTLFMGQAGEDYKDQLMTMKAGDKFSFLMSKIEKGEKTTEHVRKYLMKVEDEELDVNDTWEGKIVEVKRMTPAALNEEFYKKAFGPDTEITNEEEAKTFIRKMLTDYYEQQGDQLMFYKIEERLKNNIDFDLPEAFLKRWFKEVNTEANEEELEADFPKFIKNTKWDLVKSKFSKLHDLKVEDEEIRNEVIRRVSNAYGQYGLGQDFIIEQVKSILKNRETMESIAAQMMEQKVYDKLKDLYTIEDTTIPMDDFKELLEKQAAANNPPAQPSEEEE